MTRKEVHDIMFRANTLEQCAQAWKARSAYLREYSDDEGIIDEGKALWMTEQALENMAAQKQELQPQTEQRKQQSVAPALIALYSQLVDEDVAVAEEGMGDYAKQLEEADKA